MKSKQHHAVIIIPGLGDETVPVRFAVRYWQAKYGLTPIIFQMHWKKLDEDFEAKFSRLVTFFDSVCNAYEKLSLIGYSAGGSAVVNLFLNRKDKVSRVVNVCGRLEKGKSVFPTLEEASKVSPAFAESVIKVQRGLATLNHAEKQKILSISSRYGDNVVPLSTTRVHGLVNRTVPMYGHIPSIIYTFLFPEKMINFLHSND